MGKTRFVARCLLVACACLPALMFCGDAFGEDRITVNVDTGRPAATDVPRMEVRAGRVHVVYTPGVAGTVRVGDEVSVTVRGGCPCPAKPPTRPTATRPPRPKATKPPPSSRPAVRPTARPARARPTPTPTLAPARPSRAPAAVAPRPVPRGVPVAEPEPPAATASFRVVAAPPEDDPPESGFANWIAPALVVSIVPAALAALTPGAGRRGVRT